MKPPIHELLSSRILTITVLSVFFLSGCINEQMITDRPSFAFPQNLISLCGKTDTLSFKNRGEYRATSGFKSDLGYNYTNESSKLLLSTQLLPGEPEWHRDIDTLKLNLNAQSVVSIQTLDKQGIVQEHDLPPEDISCSESGELRLSFDPDSYYFYASVGKSNHELVLWTNSMNDLILHSRWKESMAGLIGGSITGDAWAKFEVAEPATVNASISLQEKEISHDSTGQNCENLSGSYNIIGESVSVDGTIRPSNAGEQFFREEQVGTYTVDSQLFKGNQLNLTQHENGEISLSLFEDDELLANRTMDAEAILCENNHWVYEGSSESITPAWILLFGTGGLNWERLELWRNAEGELLVKSMYKLRGVVLFVPFGRTDRLLNSFASLEK